MDDYAITAIVGWPTEPEMRKFRAVAAEAEAAERERLARRPLTRDQIALVATYAPEGVTDTEVAEIVFKVELMHGIRD